MGNPVILAVDDPLILRAVERDLSRRYARECRVVRAAAVSDTMDGPRASGPG